MATVLELVTEANGLLKKAAKVTANQADLVRFFNECRRRLQRKSRIIRQWTAPLTQGATTYTLTVAAYPIHELTKVYYTPTGSTNKSPLDILPIDYEDQPGIRFQRALPGEVSHTLFICPGSLAGTLTLYGALRLQVLTAESTPEIDEEFHSLFPLFAACRFGGQDEDFMGDGRFPNFKREFLELEAAFNQAQTSRHKGPRFIRARG